MPPNIPNTTTARQGDREVSSNPDNRWFINNTATLQTLIRQSNRAHVVPSVHFLDDIVESVATVEQSTESDENAIPEFTLSIQEVKENNRTLYAVRVVRNGVLYDEARESTKQRALSRLNSYKKGYQNDITFNSFDIPVVNDIEKRNITGVRVARMMRRPRTSINRRARRPSDDVVKEDDLVLDIPNDNNDTIENTFFEVDEALSYIDEFDDVEN